MLDILQESSTTAEGKQDRDDRVAQYLAGLIPPGLWRSERLDQDIAYLSKRVKTPPRANDHLTADFEAHIRQSTQSKPHVLLAYAWVMYMATFSGGRWIRQQLRDAGPAFWRDNHRQTSSSSRSSPSENTQPSQPGTSDSVPGVSFLCFAGAHDGEDIKTDFKTRLSRADDLLTRAQKSDVIVEAEEIFRRCIVLVEGLDRELDRAALLAGGKKGSKGRLDASAGDGKKEKTVQERAREEKQTTYDYPTQGLDPIAAFLCICVGVGLWYYLYSLDLLPSTGII